MKAMATAATPQAVKVHEIVLMSQQVEIANGLQAVAVTMHDLGWATLTSRFRVS